MTGAETKVPQHIAIILDGNGRWAKQRRMPRGYGHIIGCQNLEHMCNVIKDRGVKYLRYTRFPRDNWKRSRDEVEGLLKLFRQYLKRCMRSAKKNKMRVKDNWRPVCISAGYSGQYPAAGGLFQGLRSDVFPDRHELRRQGS